MAPKTVKPNGKGASAPVTPRPPKKTAKTASKPAVVNKEGLKTHYIRNLHNGAGGARMLLSDGTKIELAPRGWDSDCALVNEEIASDPLYQRNIGLLFEELTHEQGLEVLKKQHTNAQAPRKTTLEHMTNAKGEPYAPGAVQVEIPFEQQGKVVGHVSPAVEGHSHQDGGNLTRNVLGPQEVSRPGSRPVDTGPFNPDVMPSGLTMEQAQEYLNAPPELREGLIIQWQEEAGVGIGRLQASVTPTQKEE